ncbi:MAG: hypothetical protein QME74_11040 [Candidatus Edwardsbacteria bacterium]|nr:hypothetical protein [Candidatus Edwardsbacteria bacterium]
MAHLLIRRTRNNILRWYGFDSETHRPIDPSHFREYQDGRRRAYVLVGGRHQFFPKRVLETIEYSIEETYQGLYLELRNCLGKARKGQPVKPPPGELTCARYGLWHYVKGKRQKKEPYASLHRAAFLLPALLRFSGGGSIGGGVPSVTSGPFFFGVPTTPARGRGTVFVRLMAIIRCTTKTHIVWVAQQ